MNKELLKKQQEALLRPERPQARTRERKFSVICTISDNAMKASVRVAAVSPDCGIEAHDIVAKLYKQGVRTGIDMEKVERVAADCLFGQDIVVAEGFSPEDGADAVLVPQIELERFTTAEDVKNFPGQRIRKGVPVRLDQPVIAKTPATPGKPGMTVRGFLIAPKPGADIPLEAGDNLSLSEDGLTLVAAMPGLAGIADGKPAVREEDYDEWKFDIQLRKGKMEAVLIITPGIQTQPGIDEKFLAALLESKGVRFGVDDIAIRRIPANIRSTMIIPMAAGEPPKPGADSEIIEHFRSGAKQGQALFRVAKGQVIVEKLPALKGHRGRNVLDEPVPPGEGKDVELKAGAHTQLSADGLTLTADIDGYISREKDAYCVVECREIKPGDGQLQKKVDFEGMIRIVGDLPAGHTVVAGHHIEITGSVRDGSAVAGGALVVRGEAGGGQSRLQSGGDMHVRAARDARLVSGGDVFIGETARGCDIVAAGEVRQAGGRADIIASRVVAAGDVLISNIGSVHAEQTDIAIGAPLDIRIRNDFSARELIATMKRNELLVKAMKSLVPSGGEMDMPTAGKYASLKLMHEVVAEKLRFHRENVVKLQAAIRELSRNRQVTADSAVYPNTGIRIGNAAMRAERRIERTVFSLSDDGTKIVETRL